MSTRRSHPYFKVQYFNTVAITWKDERGAFDTLADARSYIEDRKRSGKEYRIMVVSANGRSVLAGDGQA